MGGGPPLRFIRTISEGDTRHVYRAMFGSTVVTLQFRFDPASSDLRGRLHNSGLRRQYTHCNYVHARSRLGRGVHGATWMASHHAAAESHHAYLVKVGRSYLEARIYMRPDGSASRCCFLGVSGEAA